MLPGFGRKKGKTQQNCKPEAELVIMLGQVQDFLSVR